MTRSGIPSGCFLRASSSIRGSTLRSDPRPRSMTPSASFRTLGSQYLKEVNGYDRYALQLPWSFQQQIKDVVRERRVSRQAKVIRKQEVDA